MRKFLGCSITWRRARAWMILFFLFTCDNISTKRRTEDEWMLFCNQNSFFYYEFSHLGNARTVVLSGACSRSRVHSQMCHLWTVGSVLQALAVGSVVLLSWQVCWW
jgi:hypothetical protein